MTSIIRISLPSSTYQRKIGGNVTRRERPHLGERKKILDKTDFRIFDPGVKTIISDEIVNLICLSINSVLRSRDSKITQGFEKYRCTSRELFLRIEPRSPEEKKRIDFH
ncbi:hypothetical protein AVEN_10466-1 [Araneus ventricosus]|uniref:Uncharacterized protein n=1 Tax=Araneus ventricosus TaxID=182803 RepID=A0A4Y2LA56_ARAVE|nr:hypothetical protein AVEN_10466-1 [Araneus ventricosus]